MQSLRHSPFLEECCPSVRKIIAWLVAGVHHHSCCTNACRLSFENNTSCYYDDYENAPASHGASLTTIGVHRLSMQVICMWVVGHQSNATPAQHQLERRRIWLRQCAVDKTKKKSTTHMHAWICISILISPMMVMMKSNGVCSSYSAIPPATSPHARHARGAHHQPLPSMHSKGPS